MPSATDIRSGLSSAHPSPKVGHRQIPTLPPINTPHTNGQRASHDGRTQPPSPTPHGDLQSARSLKMQSILNPSGDDRRTSAGGSTPVSPKNAGPRTLPPVSGLTSPYGQLEAGHRAYRGSLGTNKSPWASTASTPLTGTPNAAQATRATYGFPGPSTTNSERRGSDSIATAPQSLTNSPTTSYSSYVPTQRNSPTGSYAQMAAPSQYGGHPNGSIMMSTGHDHSQYPHRGSGSSSNAYQLMTIDTDQGPIQVPVDVQAASKVADEKRKRNAGASARFRQRRKEKEREASQTISRLESKMREVAEEKEYYRMERDYFRELVYTTPASAHVTPRLPSPKQRKAAGGKSGRTSSHASAQHSPVEAPTDWQQSGERGGDDGRNQRRRISGYEQSAPPPSGYPCSQAAGPAAPYGYPRPNGAPLPPGHYPPGPGYHHAYKPSVS